MTARSGADDCLILTDVLCPSRSCERTLQPADKQEQGAAARDMPQSTAARTVAQGDSSSTI